MSNLLTYKNYKGSVLYSIEDQCFHGCILNIRSVISYGAESIAELKQMFEAAVDDYLASCHERGVDPEKPNSSNK